MTPFREPAPSNLDLVFTMFGIQIRVHPLFWLISLLIGVQGRDLNGILSWIITVFVSILIHELGHSFAMRYYGQDSHIVLYSFGGLAIPKPSFGYQRSGPNRHSHYILIALAGPFAGFLLGGLICLIVWALGGVVWINWLYDMFPMPAGYFYGPNQAPNVLVNDFLFVNVFWGLVNLVPVQPLDGGHVSEHLHLIFNPLNGRFHALWLSIFTGVLLAILAFVGLQSIYMSLMFGYLAYRSYQVVRANY